MDEEHKVPNFLKKYNIELRTILYDSAASKLFSWLANNITDENVLTDDELRDYFEMEQTESTCEQQEILHGEDLKIAIEDINKKFPNLTTYTDDDVQKYENELDELAKLTEHYEAVLDDSNTVLKESKKKNSLLNKKLNIVDEQEERLNTECIQNLKEAQEMHNDIKKTRQEIDTLCTSVHIAPSYMHQFPLDEFFSNCRDFNNYCDQYLRKNFEVIDANMSDIETESALEDKYMKEIEKINQVINNNTVKLKMAEMKLSSLKAVIKELENFNRISYDYQDMKHELGQMNQNNKEMNLNIHILKENLKESVIKLNQQKVNSLIHDANSHKLQRADQRLKDVQTMENISHKFLLLCELLWLTVNFDTDMLNTYKNVLKEDTVEERNHLNCLKRIDKLNALLLEDPIANYSIEFCNEITKRLNRSNFNQITLTEYDDIVANIPVQLDSISNKLGYSDINNMMQYLQSNANKLIKLLDDGPLTRPQVVKANIINVIYNCGIENIKILKRLSDQKQTFKDYFHTKWNNNKIWRYNQVLWIYFLTEPKKVIDAIEDIKLQETKSRKLVSGLLCKRN